jgi:ribosome-binding factor A
LAKRLQTRFTPVLQFVLDQGVKNSIEMTRLINEALTQAPPPAPGPEEEEERPGQEAPADGAADQGPGTV